MLESHNRSALEAPPVPLATWASLGAEVEALRQRATTADLRSLSPEVVKLAERLRSATCFAELAPSRFSVYQTLLALADVLGVDDADDEPRRALLEEGLAELGAIIAERGAR